MQILKEINKILDKQKLSLQPEWISAVKNILEETKKIDEEKLDENEIKILKDFKSLCNNILN